ncbi:MAG: NADH-quinone oxidoreductase subunit B family protein [Candidatus Heimdallarchaeaceae archaeon]
MGWLKTFGVNCALKSPWIIHMNAGGCNGCDIEIVDALTPRHDIEQYGITLRGTPRQADVLVITGPVTLQVAERVKRVYEQMPLPKFVVAVGNCSTSGGVFQECPFILGGIDHVLPIDAWVYGCPPRPENIVAAVATLLGKLKGDLLGIEQKEIPAE